MDTVVDVVPAGETVIAVKADPTAPVDLLGRQEIVDRIMKILEVISEKKSSCTFALNGAWGTGKTFVLNMLMNQLWEYHSDKYIVFHYNCWQYDYYEEPLIAIVAAMLDSVDEENHLLPENLRDKAKAGMELAKPVLKKIATDFVKNKIGVDLTDVVSTANSFKEAVDSEEKKRAEAYSFDEFYSFKKAIQQAQKEISKLTEDRTLVVVVDELDRCLPNYAIKVLERLHHLFLGVENTAVLLAVDKGQLDKTILRTFGDNTDTTKYLHKFIKFELTLNVGSISGDFRKKHQDYFDLFDESIIETVFPYDEFLAALFFGIDPRTQEQLMGRIKTVHTMLFPNKKMDYSIMCGELIYVVLTQLYGITSSPFQHYSAVRGNPGFHLRGKYSLELYNFVQTYWSEYYTFLASIFTPSGSRFCIRGEGTIQKALIYYFNHLLSQEKNQDVYEINHIEFPNIDLKMNLSALEQVRDLLTIIH